MYCFATSLSGNTEPNKGFMPKFDQYKKCASTVLIFHRMAASCSINCGVAAVIVVCEEFCWANIGTNTQPSLTHHVDCLWTTKLVCCQLLEWSSWRTYSSLDEISLCYFASWKSCERPEPNPPLALYWQCPFSCCCKKYTTPLWIFLDFFQRSSARQLSLKVVTPRFLGPGILL